MDKGATVNAKCHKMPHTKVQKVYFPMLFIHIQSQKKNCQLIPWSGPNLGATCGTSIPHSEYLNILPNSLADCIKNFAKGKGWKKKFCLIINLRHTYFFQFLGGGTLFSLDLGPKGGSNFKALWRSHLTSVRGPISYRIRFMTRRSFFVFLFFFH